SNPDNPQSSKEGWGFFVIRRFDCDDPLDAHLSTNAVYQENQASNQIQIIPIDQRRQRFFRLGG
uniref:hypothetical protein n=1 Tax=Psychromonas sp. Urea-02u-13 TaxID=2058326 RepID=UPI000CC0C294